MRLIYGDATRPISPGQRDSRLIALLTRRRNARLHTPHLTHPHEAASAPLERWAHAAAWFENCEGFRPLIGVSAGLDIDRLRREAELAGCECVVEGSLSYPLDVHLAAYGDVVPDDGGAVIRLAQSRGGAGYEVLTEFPSSALPLQEPLHGRHAPHRPARTRDQECDLTAQPAPATLGDYMRSPAPPHSPRPAFEDILERRGPDRVVACWRPGARLREPELSVNVVVSSVSVLLLKFSKRVQCTIAAATSQPLDPPPLSTLHAAATTFTIRTPYSLYACLYALRTPYSDLCTRGTRHSGHSRAGTGQ